MSFLNLCLYKNLKKLHLEKNYFEAFQSKVDLQFSKHYKKIFRYLSNNSSSKIPKKDKIMQAKPKWSSRGPPASVRINDSNQRCAQKIAHS